MDILNGFDTHPFAMAVGDYNSDKKLNFAVADYGNDYLNKYLQTC